MPGIEGVESMKSATLSGGAFELRDVGYWRFQFIRSPSVVVELD